MSIALHTGEIFIIEQIIFSSINIERDTHREKEYIFRKKKKSGPFQLTNQRLTKEKFCLSMLYELIVPLHRIQPSSI